MLAVIDIHLLGKLLEMMNQETQITQVTFYQAREIILAMIRVALMDLNSSDLLQKQDAADWLTSEGISLSIEIKAGIGPEQLLGYIHEAETIGKLRRKRHYCRGNRLKDRSYEQKPIG